MDFIRRQPYKSLNSFEIPSLNHCVAVILIELNRTLYEFETSLAFL